MLLRYHNKQFGLLNFNQLERVIEEKALIDIADSLQTITHCVDILVNQIITRKYSLTLSKALQTLSRLIG